MDRMKDDYKDILDFQFDKKNQIAFTTVQSCVYTDHRKPESLDGVWGFTPDVFRSVTRKNLFSASGKDEQGRAVPMDLDFSSMEKIQVPGCWNCLDDRYWLYEGEAVYSRTFVYSKEKEGERIILRVGAANYECRIWLNGTLLSRHQGGFTPFYTELTQDLKEINHIVITVNNRREPDQVPSMNYDWFNYGGITRSVELFRLPAVYIKDFTASLVPDGTYGRIELKIKLDAPVQGACCHFKIEELGISREVLTDERGEARCVVQANPQLWDCEHPKLYEVQARCLEDQVKDRVGFREIRCDGKDILLNGRKIYLKGVCCHEESRNRGRIHTDEERLEILNTAKDMGCNILRLTHYPHSERMAVLADQAGMMLWEEIPVYWALDFENPETYSNAENQMRELMFRDKNRASVVIWSVGNENPDIQSRLDFMKGLLETCRNYDPTRLTSAACLVDVNTMCVKDRLAEFVDVVAFNEYYGWYYRDYEGVKVILDNTSIDKPMVITETGAGAKAGHHGGAEELFTEEHQERVYENQIRYTDGRIQGMFPWVLFDFISPIRKHPMQGGKNSKGLVAMDKATRKKAFYVMQEYYRNK